MCFVCGYRGKGSTYHTDSTVAPGKFGVIASAENLNSLQYDKKLLCLDVPYSSGMKV